MLKSNERSKDSYIGLADFFLFFFRKQFVHTQFLFFAVRFFVNFSVFYCQKEGKIHYLTAKM